MRQLLPPGRILHLLPAHASDSSHSLTDLLRDSSGPNNELLAEAAAEEGATSGPAGASASSQGDEGGVSCNPLYIPSPSGGGGGATGAQQPGTASARVQQQPAAPQKYVLMTVNRQAYSRIKLCKTMVYDHFVPQYLRAVDNLLQQLEDNELVR